MFYIYDQTMTYLATIESSVLIEAKHHETLKGESVLRFSLSTDESVYTNLKENYYVAFTKNNISHLFQIMELDIDHSSRVVEVFADNEFFCLRDVWIVKESSKSVTTFLTNILADSDWALGTVSANTESKIAEYLNYKGVFERMSSLEILHELQSYAHFEFKYNVSMTSTTVNSKTVDLLEKRQASIGYDLTYGTNVKGIDRNVDMSNVNTAVYAYGGTVQRTNNGETENYILSLSSPIEDTNALSLYGRQKGTKHRYGVYENSDIKNKRDLHTFANDYLQKTKEPIVNYKVALCDINANGIQLGDGVDVIDNYFNPAHTFSTRVIVVERDLLDDLNTRIELGNERRTLVYLAREVEEAKEQEKPNDLFYLSQFDVGEISCLDLEGIDITDSYREYLAGTITNYDITAELGCTKLEEFTGLFLKEKENYSSYLLEIKITNVDGTTTTYGEADLTTLSTRTFPEYHGQEITVSVASSLPIDLNTTNFRTYGVRLSMIPNAFGIRYATIDPNYDIKLGGLPQVTYEGHTALNGVGLKYLLPYTPHPNDTVIVVSDIIYGKAHDNNGDPIRIMHNSGLGMEMGATDASGNKITNFIYPTA